MTYQTPTKLLIQHIHTKYTLNNNLQRHHTLRHTKLRTITHKLARPTAVRITLAIQTHFPDSNESMHPTYPHKICSEQDAPTTPHTKAYKTQKNRSQNDQNYSHTYKTTKTTAIRITWTIQRHVPDSNETSHPAHRHTICSLQPHQPLPYRNSNTNSFESTTISSQKFNISTPIDAPMFTSPRTDTYRTLVAKPKRSGLPVTNVTWYLRNWWCVVLIRHGNC